MKIYTDIKKWIEDLPTTIAERNGVYLAYSVNPRLEVVYGTNADVNFQYCQEHNIPTHCLRYDAGSIVCSQGNVLLGLFYNNRITREFSLLHLMRDFADYLKAKGLNIEYNHNDILVDGFKTCSSTGFNMPPDWNWSYEGAQISINQNIEAIQNICTKPMVKIPKALSLYGITTEEVRDWTIDWLADYFKQDKTAFRQKILEMLNNIGVQEFDINLKTQTNI